jgi:hypothetical protein
MWIFQSIYLSYFKMDKNIKFRKRKLNPISKFKNSKLIIINNNKSKIILFYY